MATIDGNQKKLTVSGELIESAVNSKHEHSNKTVLDKLTDNNGTLQYNGADITGGGSSEPYSLPIASNTKLGGVKIDGDTIVIDGNGVISATATGTGLTEEQTINVAKIPVIEGNVTTNTASITELSNRVEAVESGGISEDAVEQIVSDYIAENGVLTDNCIGSNHLSNDILGTLYKVETTSTKGIKYSPAVTGDKVTTSTIKVSFRVTAITTINALYTNITIDSSATALGTEKNFAAGETRELVYTIDKAYSNKVFGKATIYPSAASTYTIEDFKVYFDDAEYTDLVADAEDSATVVVTNLIPDKFNVVEKGYFQDKLAEGIDKAVNEVNRFSSNKTYRLYNQIGADNGFRAEYKMFSIYAPANIGDEITFEADVILHYKDGLADYRNNDLSFSIRNESNTSVLSTTFKSASEKPLGIIHASGKTTSADGKRITSVYYSFNGDIDAEIFNINVTVGGIRYELSGNEVESPYLSIIKATENKHFATTDYVDKMVNKDKVDNKPTLELKFPNTIYLVDSEKNRRALPVFIDYLYGRISLADEERVLFANGEDRMYIDPQVVVRTSNMKKQVDFISEFYNVPSVTYNRVTVPESYANGDIRCLTIGDSVTAGAITKQQYWSYAAQLFATEDELLHRKSKVMFLGSNNERTVNFDVNGVSKTVQACACGTSSWSFDHWLKNDNNGSTNGFAYTDDEGKVQFSILKWIERYRNYDDEGNKLSLDDPKIGTMITESNIDKVICCTPNIIYLNSTHNENSTNIVNNHKRIINIIRTELPDCKIIIGAPMPLLGSWWKERYVGKDWLEWGLDKPNYGAQGDQIPKRRKIYDYVLEQDKINDWLFYLPQMVLTPTVEGVEYDLVETGVKTMKRVTTQSLPKEHPGTHTHKIWGYELYALLKFIKAQEQGLDTNEITVALNTDSINLDYASSTKTYKLTGTPSDGTSAITWTSSDESVATVDSTGLVTLVHGGSCYIFAETNKSIKPAVCKVTVHEAVDRVEIDETVNVAVEGTVQLNYTVYPETASNKAVTFSSNNNCITVSDTGLVTGITGGTATVTITTDDGSHTDTCIVTVTDIRVSAAEANTLMADANNWYSGQYGSSGAVETNTSRIYFDRVVRVTPGGTYSVNTGNDNYKFVVRELKADMSISNSKGAVTNGTSNTAGANTSFIALSLYKVSGGATSDSLISLIDDGTLTLSVSAS